MKVAFIALTKKGMEQAAIYAETLPVRPDLYLHEHIASDLPDVRHFQNLRVIVPELWANYRLIVFIMATGIVIRHVSQFLQAKDRDPAILAGDEGGKFIIPLLSGHLGGANAWANYFAHNSQATAVITTATDVNGFIAPDEYARRLKWKIDPITNLKIVNRNLLEQGFLKVWSDFPLPSDHPIRKDPNYIYLGKYDEGNLETGLSTTSSTLRSNETLLKEQSDVIISTFWTEIKNQIRLIPPLLSIGVGCRKGITKDLILDGLELALKQIQASNLAIKGLYSIDRKSDESGLQQAAEQLGIPFMTFSAQDIQSVNERRNLAQSTFVRKELGVDGVCEAASLLGTIQGELILRKCKDRGMTFAISLEKYLSSESVQEIPNI